MYKQIEEIALNTWPSLQTHINSGWLLRNAGGYTKRSNSVNPLYFSFSGDVNRLIHDCERYYTSLHLDTIFKITPYVLPENLDNILESLEYIVVDESSVRMLELACTPKPKMKAVVQDHINDEWLNCLTEINHLTDQNKEITRQLLEKSTLQKGYFSLYDNYTPVACGLGIIQDNYVGLYDIVTNAEYRRMGFGEQLVLNILDWGRSNGALFSFLQVVEQNLAAKSLYNKLGYKEIYKYWYRIKKTPEGSSFHSPWTR